MMPNPIFTILYVRDPLASAAFYARLLGKPAIESSPGFALFALQEQHLLGLWLQAEVNPAPGAQAGGAELAFSQGSREAVDLRYAAWLAAGAEAALAPCGLDFGYAAAVRDPDGHLLRAFCPA